MFKFAPEVGYDLSEDWSVAVIFGYEVNKSEDGEEMKAISVMPYARYNLLKTRNFKLFLDGAFEIASVDDGYEESSAWGIGIKPGIAYSLTEKFSLVATWDSWGIRRLMTNFLNFCPLFIGAVSASTLITMYPSEFIIRSDDRT